jgi:hypothetical protein
MGPPNGGHVRILHAPACDCKRCAWVFCAIPIDTRCAQWQSATVGSRPTHTERHEMKPTKITDDIKIDAALAAINGRAASHTFTDAAEVAKIAAEAEALLENLGIPTKVRAGAVFFAQSGSRLPTSYKYTAIVTIVQLSRKSNGWYLTDVRTARRHLNSQPGRKLMLTIAQDDLAIAHLRRAYLVQGGAA